MSTSDSPVDAIQLQTGPEPTWSVIWLHGLGADGNDFVPLVPELVQADWPALRFVFPNAPERAVTPGQWVVFYDGETCLGGGPIDRTEPQKAIRI